LHLLVSWQEGQSSSWSFFVWALFGVLMKNDDDDVVVVVVV